MARHELHAGAKMPRRVVVQNEVTFMPRQNAVGDLHSRVLI